MQIFNVEQGSDEWRQLRCGVITASDFSKVLAKGEGRSRRKLIMEKVGERITGIPTENYYNDFMNRGKTQEPIARELYEIKTGNEVELCGFILNTYGCSVDGLVDINGGLEIKTRKADIQAELILADKIPNENLAQVYGNLLIAEREWWDFVSYSPGMPLFTKRAYRDEKYITNLRTELDRCDNEIKEIVQQITQKF